MHCANAYICLLFIQIEGTVTIHCSGTFAGFFIDMQLALG